MGLYSPVSSPRNSQCVLQDLRSSANVSSVSSFGFDFSMQNLRLSPRSSMMFGGGVSVVHRLCILRFFILFGVLVGVTW